jgi:hypothetical protein
MNLLKKYCYIFRIFWPVILQVGPNENDHPNSKPLYLLQFIVKTPFYVIFGSIFVYSKLYKENCIEINNKCKNMRFSPQGSRADRQKIRFNATCYFWKFVVVLSSKSSWPVSYFLSWKINYGTFTIFKNCNIHIYDFYDLCSAILFVWCWFFLESIYGVFFTGYPKKGHFCDFFKNFSILPIGVF